jgi:hypothetical protein
MENPTGEPVDGVLRLDLDRQLPLQFRGSVVTSDAGLPAYRGLDDALGLSVMAGSSLGDARTGKNGRHALVGLLPQSVFARLAGNEDINDAERLRHDPASDGSSAARRLRVRQHRRARWGRFETRWLTAERNLAALADLSGQWINRVHSRRPARSMTLDMGSSATTPHGEQEMSVWNGHYRQDSAADCRTAAAA